MFDVFGSQSHHYLDDCLLFSSEFFCPGTPAMGFCCLGLGSGPPGGLVGTIAASTELRTVELYLSAV